MPHRSLASGRLTHRHANGVANDLAQWLVLVAASACAVAACSGTVAPAAGSGGAPVASTGGATGTGGAATGGGATGSGGNNVGSGGAPASGTGGRGGSSGTGGALAVTGGRTGAGTGGATGAGGTTDGGLAPQPFKGVALLESTATCADIATLGLTWYYNWTTSTRCQSSAQFVPQIWGHPNEAITTEINSAVTAGRQVVLGFNEPDNTGQSNMPVATAISLWPQLDRPSLRLGSPATSANAAGMAWFQQFMTDAQAQALRVDFIAVHWYGWNAGSCDNANTLEAYIRWAEQWKLPIWITEWGCLNVSGPTAATVKGFYDAAIAMFQRHPLIERYGWFLSRATDTNAIINSTSATLTGLGTDYAAAPATH